MGIVNMIKGIFETKRSRSRTSTQTEGSKKALGPMDKAELDSLVKGIRASGCGCSRHSARDFYERHALGKSSVERKLQVYDAVRGHLFSYCRTTGSATSSNNRYVIQDALSSVLGGIETVPSTQRYKLARAQLGLIDDLCRNGGVYGDFLNRDNVSRLRERAAALATSGDHESAIEFVLAYEKAAQAVSSSREGRTEADAQLSKELLGEYRLPAVRGLCKDKEVPVIEKLERIKRVLYQTKYQGKANEQIARFQRFLEYDAAEELISSIEEVYGDRARRASYDLEHAQQAHAKKRQASEKPYATELTGIERELNALPKSLAGADAALDRIRSQWSAKRTDCITRRDAELGKIDAEYHSTAVIQQSRIDAAVSMRAALTEKVEKRTMTAPEYESLQAAIGDGR